jgi:Flp pilus assembly protein TadG
MKRRFAPISTGQTLVEFALAIPVLLLLTVVIFDLGRAVFYSSVVHNAAREGARWGVINPDDDLGMIAAAKKYAVGLGVTDPTVLAGLGPVEVVAGINNPTVIVTVSYAYRPATPLVEQFLQDSGGMITLVGEATMRTEALPSSP